LGDTLHRGTLTELTGRVLDDGGSLIQGYRGTATLRIYDSGVVRNVVPTDASIPPFDYTLTGAPIYRGEVPVVDGAFSVRFRTPAALRTGERAPAGAYAYVEDDNVDGFGALDSLLVPEAEAAHSLDQQGPAITLHLEGDPRALPSEAWFTAGLRDSSGIDITGLVGSRSVVAEVEEQGNLVYIENLASQVNFAASYDSASVRSHLPASLLAGHDYDLVLRASDNLRNGSTARLSFRISTGESATFSLSDVFNFPNPTEGETRFMGHLTQDAEIDIQIFTITGRPIWRLDRPVRVSALQFSEDGILWDGRDRKGGLPSNGVYFYKVTARPVGGGAAESRVERLVVYRPR
jgi:hypothetical protein